MDTTGIAYHARLHRVMDYIDAHLGEQMDLETLAQVALFSKYHFHRVFSSYVGETIGAYVQRLRLEKAAGKVADQRGDAITAIAMDLGFSSPAVFSRMFKEHFGCSPTQWRRGACKVHGNAGTSDSNHDQVVGNLRRAGNVRMVYGTSIKPFWRVYMEPKQSGLSYQVSIEQIPDKTVAYVRHTGPYAGDVELFGRMFNMVFAFVASRNLFVPGKTETLAVYHDSPDITDEDKLRFSACVTVPQKTEPSGEVGIMTLQGGTYAVAKMRISVEQYGEAWNSVCGTWLPESGYQCADGPCYELYLNDPAQDPEAMHEIAIHVPVKPL